MGLLLFRIGPCGLLLGPALFYGLALVAGTAGSIVALVATGLLAGAYGRVSRRSWAFAIACALTALAAMALGVAVVAALGLQATCGHRDC